MCHKEITKRHKTGIYKHKPSSSVNEHLLNDIKYLRLSHVMQIKDFQENPCVDTFGRKMFTD